MSAEELKPKMGTSRVNGATLEEGWWLKSQLHAAKPNKVTG